MTQKAEFATFDSMVDFEHQSRDIARHDMIIIDKFKDEKIYIRIYYKVVCLGRKQGHLKPNTSLLRMKQIVAIYFWVILLDKI